MAIRSILIPATRADDCPPRLRLALDLGRRLEAHIRLVFVHEDPTHTYGNLPEVIRAAGVTAEQIDREIHDEASRCRAALDLACSRAKVRSDGGYESLHTTFGSWAERCGTLEPLVAAEARTSDLVVVMRPDARDPQGERLFDTAVFSSGRPALVLCGAPSPDILHHVVVAWNGSLEGARLVGHALDLLRAADRVSIVCAAEQGRETSGAGDLRDYLTWHGIRAHPLAASRVSDSVAGDIVAAATAAGASLLAMGAYTQSRIRQVFLGGLTRAALAQSTFPVLMEH